MMTPQVPAGRSGVAQNVITGTGVARADIKTNGTWIVANGVGTYTAPAYRPPQRRYATGGACHAGKEHYQELVTRCQRTCLALPTLR